MDSCLWLGRGRHRSRFSKKGWKRSIIRRLSVLCLMILSMLGAAITTAITVKSYPKQPPHLILSTLYLINLIPLGLTRAAVCNTRSLPLQMRFVFVFRDLATQRNHRQRQPPLRNSITAFDELIRNIFVGVRERDERVKD